MNRIAPPRPAAKESGPCSGRKSTGAKNGQTPRLGGGRTAEERGALKFSSVFRAYAPVYTPLFGCNGPFRLERESGKSESGPSSIPYLPTEVRDAGQFSAGPLFPRRFPKAVIGA